MARVILERFFAPESLDALFQRTASCQYQRELLFSSVVELMQDVVLGVEPSVLAAYRKRRHRLTVTDDSIYGKLKCMELGVSAALVNDSAQRARAAIKALHTRQTPWLPGYQIRILDGNALSATEHRLEPLRHTWAAPLPGKAVVVMDPELGLATDVFLTPDGHAQECSLIDDILQTVRARDVWLADRHYCNQRFLAALAARAAFFVIRQHGCLKGKLLGQRRARGVTDTGQVFEQKLELRDGEKAFRVRRVTLELYQPTRDGEMVLHLLTNLPSKVSAVQVAELYRRRWTIEMLFYEVTQTLACEVKALCYPAAALFVFCLALLTANAVAVLKAALRARLGVETANMLSAYYLTLEIKQVYRGMMIVLPPERWIAACPQTDSAFVTLLKWLAGHVDVESYRKSKRGPKKAPPPKDTYRNGGHASTHKLLQEKAQ